MDPLTCKDDNQAPCCHIIYIHIYSVYILIFFTTKSFSLSYPRHVQVYVYVHFYVHVRIDVAWIWTWTTTQPVLTLRTQHSSSLLPIAHSPDVTLFMSTNHLPQSIVDLLSIFNAIQWSFCGYIWKEKAFNNSTHSLSGSAFKIFCLPNKLLVYERPSLLIL